MARILVVDDDPLALQVIGETLRDAGHTVQGADDGSRVIEELLADTYEVMILDVNMPKVSGGKLMEMVQRMVPQPHPRVLLFSGEEASKLRRLYRRLGLHGFVRKGCSKEQLLQVVDEAIAFYQREHGGDAPAEPESPDGTE